jgi:hypothetical protein
MRFMLTLRVPPEEGNAAMKEGSFMSAFQSVVEELLWAVKPPTRLEKH